MSQDCGSAGNVARRIDNDTAVSGGCWWESSTAHLIVELVKAGPVIAVLAQIAEVLQEGHDPLWVVGGESATAAVEVAAEWLDAGVDPTEVGDWLRAGCWGADAARQMMNVGLRPGRLLDAEGRPRHLVDIGPEGEIPLALAVAESYMTPHEAVRVVVGQVGCRS